MMSFISLIKREVSARPLKIKKTFPGSIEKAMNWIRKYENPNGATIPHARKNVVPLTQETAGYLIETLYHWGEKELSRKLAGWEAEKQRPDGAFTAVDNAPYTFDTAQVIRGFLAVLDDMPEIEDHIRRACDYVERHIGNDGNVLHDTYETWKLPDGSMLSEYGNLYVLPPMLEAGKRLSEQKYIDAARRGMDYFRRKKDLCVFKSELGTLSHYFGYMMEALADMGEADLAREGLAQVGSLQRENGAIPAYPGVNWVCSTGMAQLALAWYKIGEKERPDKALEYLESLQNRKGGFYGSYGRKAAYFPDKEISWAVKFYLDAWHWRVKSDFNAEEGIYSDLIETTDGRLRAIESFLFEGHREKKVLDLGCGKGRYLRSLQSRHPEAAFYGIDVSEKMLEACPQGVKKKCGSLLNIPYPDSYFDCIYCVEALEHAILIENAIREMTRVLQPAGRMVIIDKNFRKLGAMEIKSWERWFKASEIQNMMMKYGLEASYDFVSYNKHSEPDGLFIAWKGIKR